MSPNVPMFSTKCTYTKPFAKNCGSKANESSPASPWTVTRVEMSRNGVVCSTPPCTTRIRPGRAAIKRRESPGGACKSIGAARPLLKTTCNRISKGGDSAVLVLLLHPAGRSRPSATGREYHILMGKLLGSAQHLQMRHHAPSERGERVAPLENRHDLSSGVFGGDFLDALR